MGIPAKGTALRAALQYLYTPAVNPILGSQGFDPAPAKLLTLLKSSTGPFGKTAIQAKTCPAT